MASFNSKAVVQLFFINNLLIVAPIICRFFCGWFLFCNVVLRSGEYMLEQSISVKAVPELIRGGGEGGILVARNVKLYK